MRIVVLVSGQGSNLEALLNAQEAGMLNAKIVGVISNKSEVGALAIAKRYGISTNVILRNDYTDRTTFDAALATATLAYRPDIIALAGFMHILGDAFLKHFPHTILNIHPSLLPKYKGTDTHARALAAGEIWHGATTHWVTQDLDGGPLVAQVRVPILAKDTVSSLQTRVLKAEHLLYPATIHALTCTEIFFPVYYDYDEENHSLISSPVVTMQ